MSVAPQLLGLRQRLPVQSSTIVFSGHLTIQSHREVTNVTTMARSHTPALTYTVFVIALVTLRGRCTCGLACGVWKGEESQRAKLMTNATPRRIYTGKHPIGHWHGVYALVEQNHTQTLNHNDVAPR